MATAISRRAYAKQRGVSDAAIRKSIRRGVIREAVLPSGLLDPDVADAELAKNSTRGNSAPKEVGEARERLSKARLRALLDERDAFARQYLALQDVLALCNEQFAVVITGYRSIIERAGVVAGMAGPQANTVLRDLIDEALTYISDPANGPADKAPEGAQPQRKLRQAPDLDALSPAELQALQLNVQAELIELQRFVDRKEVVHIRDCAEMLEDALAVAKSIVNGIPAIVVPIAADLSPEEVVDIVRREVERALAGLVIE